MTAVTEREWREASDMRRSVLTLAAILAVAALLRFWGLGAGIPHAPGADEPELMERAVRMMKTADFNPHVFDYPGFYIHIQLVIACVRFLAGATIGQWQALSQVSAADFYLWGRAVTALLGTATVLLLYQAGMRWGTRYAALAAGLLAVMPAHAGESHYVAPDVPVTFFVALTLVLSLRAHESARVRAFALAGAAAGLAAATKYSGALAVLLPVMAVWMTPHARPSRAAGALAAAGTAVLAFLIAAPYTILDLPAFLDGYARLAGASLEQRPGAAWLTYLNYLRVGLDWPALLMAAAGLLLGAVRAMRGPGRARWTLLVVFPVLYFWFIANRSPVAGRYLLPLIPFACLLVAVAVVSGVSLLRRFDIPRTPRTALIAALTVAALLPPLVRTVRFNVDLRRTSTLDLAYEWIVKNLPKGASIAIVGRQLRLPPEAYRAIDVPRLTGGHRAPDGHAGYGQGSDYLVVTSTGYGPAYAEPHTFPEDYAAYRQLFERSRELARFTPDAEHPGPEVRILALK